MHPLFTADDDAATPVESPSLSLPQSGQMSPVIEAQSESQEIHDDQLTCEVSCEEPESQEIIHGDQLTCEVSCVLPVTVSLVRFPCGMVHREQRQSKFTKSVFVCLVCLVWCSTDYVSQASRVLCVHNGMLSIVNVEVRLAS